MAIVVALLVVAAGVWWLTRGARAPLPSASWSETAAPAPDDPAPIDTAGLPHLAPRPFKHRQRKKRYETEVAGESAYQSALSAIAGGHQRNGHELAQTAILRPEPDNPHDPQAIAVLIDGARVGYLPTQDLPDLHAELAALDLAGRPVLADAIIMGGWVSPDGYKGHFGVRLDLARPLTLR